MGKNQMKEVAKLLDVEMDTPFYIKNTYYTPHKLTTKGLIDCYCNNRNTILTKLLTGEYEIERPVLDSIEKRYLENLLAPFKNKVGYVTKYDSGDKCFEYIGICIIGKFSFEEYIDLPYFDKETMYKGMELNKKYTLKELELFQKKRK